jgi:serine/threonine-protein kinase RsbW
MQRKILIVDDHDDLASALTQVFSVTGHDVRVLEDRAEAVAMGDLGDFDLVVTDLDVNAGESSGRVQGDECLPDTLDPSPREEVKAFKLCASNFRRDQESFDEEELKNMVTTVLDYKSQFVDRRDYVQSLREMIEFELPSSISLMHTVLGYLMKRVEKLGVVNAEQSNLFVALDEAFVNAVKHGNKFDAKKLVRIAAEVSKKEAKFTIEDEGDGFDVNSIPDPLDPQNLFKTSGRGVLFIYNIMDEVKYNDRGNRLTMVKRGDNNNDDGAVK